MAGELEESRGQVEQREWAMQSVHHKIDRARAAWRTVEMLDGLLKMFLVGGGGLIAALVADNLVHLPAAVRLSWALVLLASLAFLLLRYVLYPLVRPLTDEMVAAHLERAFPELDNRLINAVLLYGQRFRASLTRFMVASQLRQTAESVKERDLAHTGQARSLWRPGRWALGLTGAVTVYAFFFSSYLNNAFVRFVHPFKLIPPITDTRLDVRPGDAVVLQGDSLGVEARVSGVLPDSAHVHVEARAGERSSDTMAFEGNAFTYEFANVQQGFTYRIKAGDAATPRYAVRVRSRPAVRQLTLTYTYPEYTRLEQRTETGVAGDIRAPVGTTVRILVSTDRPVRRGRIEIEYLTAGQEGAPASETIPLLHAGEALLRTELLVERSARYTVGVVDPEDVPNIPRVRHIEAVPDRAPRVHFVKPGKDVAVAPDARVTLLAGAEDDFSLRALHLFVQRKAGVGWEGLRTWNYEPGTRVAREGAVLDMQELGLSVGGLLAYYMQANDGLRPQGDETGRSRIYHVRVVDAETAGLAGDRSQEALCDVIRRLIELQKANLGDTRRLAARTKGREDLDQQEQGAWKEFREQVAPLVTAEEDIYRQASDVVMAYAPEEGSSMTEALARIAAGPVARAVELLRQLQTVTDRMEIDGTAMDAQEKQAEIILLLEQLLENPAALLARILQEEGESEELSDRVDEVVTGRQLAEKLLKALDDFAEDQKRIIEMSNRLAEKPVDDFTDADEEALQEIIDREKEWAKFFQEAATDLSKLPPQDFSLATQAEEFLEVYSEVQQAAEEAEREVIELAVPFEQSGLELAEQIETNLEKWLMETKDNQLWSMEDPLEDYEIPMVELPDELQDLIGDLVESEEDMLDQFDDITSGWFDSLDIGAGWDTMDGPISNMSAKGVTGNRLPNTQEVGGRSGEGRTGKSSGQFVEQTATGKGGRQTPSRLTADPFEAGWVEDLSGDAPTGATGGGKVSGLGAEGFQGPVPPPLQQRLKRLAVHQQELIDKAKRLDYGLQKYRHPRGRLPETIELMEAQRTDLDRGELSTFGGYQRIVLSNLREIKELTDKQKQLWRDRSALLPKQLRDEIAAAQNERVPEQYREMVRNYFRALSEAGTPRR